MKLGLIGGLGPESTIKYYKELVYRFNKESEKDEFPNIAIESLDIVKVLKYASDEEYDLFSRLFIKGY